MADPVKYHQRPNTEGKRVSRKTKGNFGNDHYINPEKLSLGIPENTSRNLLGILASAGKETCRTRYW